MEGGAPPRRSPFPEQAALGPILTVSSAASSAASVAVPFTTPAAAVAHASLSALRKESVHAQSLPSSPTKQLTATMLPLRAKTPGVLGELKGLLRAPTPYGYNRIGSNNSVENNSATTIGGAPTTPGRGGGLLATAMMLGEDDEMNLNATWPFHKDARLNTVHVRATTAASTARRAQSSAAAAAAARAEFRGATSGVRPGVGPPETGNTLSPRLRTKRPQSEKQTQRGRGQSPSYKILLAEDQAMPALAVQPRARTGISERPKGASRHRSGEQSASASAAAAAAAAPAAAAAAPPLSRHSPAGPVRRGGRSNHSNANISHGSSSGRGSGSGSNGSDHSTAVRPPRSPSRKLSATSEAAAQAETATSSVKAEHISYNSDSARSLGGRSSSGHSRGPELSTGVAIESTHRPRTGVYKTAAASSKFKEIDELAQLLASASRGRAISAAGTHDDDAGAAFDDFDSALSFEVEWIAARTYPSFFEKIDRRTAAAAAAAAAELVAEVDVANVGRVGTDAGAGATDEQIASNSPSPSPEPSPTGRQYGAEDFEDDDMDTLMKINDGDDGDGGGNKRLETENNSDESGDFANSAIAEALVKPQHDDCANGNDVINADDVDEDDVSLRSSVAPTEFSAQRQHGSGLILSDSALAAVLEQTFELVSTAVTNASDAAAVACSSALFGSALLCATLYHREQQQAAYSKVAALCSARLQELEQKYAADFYTDERVSLKFEQLCKTANARNQNPGDSRLLRQDDDGGIPEGPKIKSHHPFAPYLLMLATAIAPSVYADVAGAVSQHGGELSHDALASVIPLPELLERYLGRGANGCRARSEEDKYSQREPRDALATDACRVAVTFEGLAGALAGKVALEEVFGPPLRIRHQQDEHDHHNKEDGRFRGSTVSHKLIAVHKYTPSKASTTWGELIDGIGPTVYSQVEEAAGSDWPDVKALLAEDAIRASKVSFLVQVSIELKVVGLRKQKSLAYKVARTGSWPRLQEAFAFPQ